MSRAGARQGPGHGEQGAVPERCQVTPERPVSRARDQVAHPPRAQGWRTALSAARFYKESARPGRSAGEPTQERPPALTRTTSARSPAPRAARRCDKPGPMPRSSSAPWRAVHSASPVGKKYRVSVDTSHLARPRRAGPDRGRDAPHAREERRVARRQAKLQGSIVHAPRVPGERELLGRTRRRRGAEAPRRPRPPAWTAARTYSSPSTLSANERSRIVAWIHSRVLERRTCSRYRTDDGSVNPEVSAVWA